MEFLAWVASQPTPPRNTEVSHLVDRTHGIWQFTKGRIRVLWFYDEGRIIVLTHGFLKTTPTTPWAERSKAVTASQAYFQAKRTERLHFLEDK